MCKSGCWSAMNTYAVSFFGHRFIEEPLLIEKRLEILIRKLLREKEYIEFLAGRDGEFDQLVSSVIRRGKREYQSDNNAHVLVLPYSTAEFRNNEDSFLEYYDEIEICETAAVGHFKNAHQARNREMVDRSHLVVFCVQHESGGAWQTMKYARKQGVPYINVNDMVEEEK